MFFLRPGRLGTTLRQYRNPSLVFLISIAVSAPAPNSSGETQEAWAARSSVSATARGCSKISFCM